MLHPKLAQHNYTSQNIDIDNDNNIVSKIVRYIICICMMKDWDILT